MNEAEIKKQIQDAIEDTKALIIDYKEMSKPVAPDDAIGRISRMDAINNKSVTEFSLRKAVEKLSSLERVYKQIGTKEFGKCLKCKQEIPLGRILFRPESLYCVNCAS